MKDWNLEYSFFEVSRVDEPDLTLNLGEFDAADIETILVGHKFRVAKDYFHCKDSEKNAKWEIEITGLENDRVTVNFHGRIRGIQGILTPDLLPQRMFLEPMLDYMLTKKNKVFCHSAGVSIDGKGLLLIGRGGSFKTPLAMDFIRRAGYSFLGDNRIILEKGRMDSFPTNLGLFSFMVNNLKDDRFKLIDKIRYAKNLPARNGTDKVTVNIVQSSKLSTVFFIVRRNSEHFLINEIGLEEATKKMVANNKIETIYGGGPIACMRNNHFFEYMLAYSSVFPNSIIAKYWTLLEENCRNILQGLPIFEVVIPRRYTADVFAEIRKMSEMI
jgi:hypothetical protein